MAFGASRIAETTGSAEILLALNHKVWYTVKKSQAVEVQRLAGRLDYQGEGLVAVAVVVGPY